MKVSFLGGAYEVGASCILVNIDNRNILLDCGIRQSSSKDPLPDFRTIQETKGVDAIIISHAHLDHIGTLPIISKEYPNARIYMNNMTKDLLKVLLYDSLKIMNNREAEIPLYAESDVENMLNRIFTINYEVEFKIFDDLSLTFYNAGHIAGASCVYLKGKESSIFYSGDFSVFSQKSVEGAKIPKLRPDVGIFESTYGDKLHSNREIEEDRLIDIVNQCITEKGKMLIPAFALGRSQEVILILKKAMNTNKIKKVNIYVDGMIKDINRVYKNNPLFLKNSLGKKVLRGIEPFYNDNIKPIKNKQEREAILESKESCIIISSSGMLTGGPSQSYAEKIACMENGYIVITGYQDEESPGRKLLNLLEQSPEDRVLEINTRNIPVKCKLEKVGLSAHGDKAEIKAIISRLMPKHIFLVHGDKNIISELSNELNREIRRRIYTPKSGEYFNLNIKNPRKQLKKQLSFTLNNNISLTECNINELWSFVNEKYLNKLFTIEELLFIWYGKENLDKDEYTYLKNLILSAPYFESDTRRLFLFKVKDKKSVEEDLKPKELKQNEINDLIAEYFKEYEYKKISLRVSEKIAVLNFDFPKAVCKSIYDSAKQFKNSTGWNIELNEQTNKNAADNLIRQLLKDAQIQKISFHIEENKFVVTLNKHYELTGESVEFKKLTGVNLEIKEKNSTSNSTEKDNSNFFSTQKPASKMEQNKTLIFIDEMFLYEKFKPYKKSIKSNNLGKYIELSFISPIIGEKFKEQIKKLCYETGWNFTISKSFNQNEIINTALRLCSEYKLDLCKNPSFNPFNNTVTLKFYDVIDDEVFFNLKNAFDYLTGCTLIK